MEGGFVNIDDVVLWLLHQGSGDLLGEFLLLMFEFNLSGCLGAVDDLRLAVRGAVLQVELPDRPSRQLFQLQPVSPEGRSLS